MTMWLVMGGVAALLIYIAVTRAKAKKAGRREAEGEHLANYAETIGEISEKSKESDEKFDKVEPKSDAEWDDFFAGTPVDRDKLRRKPGDKR